MIVTVDFIPINFNRVTDCAIIARWFNDPEVGYLISPQSKTKGQVLVTHEDIAHFNLNPPFPKFAYFIVCDGVFVGDVNITENPDFLLKQDGKSCWLGITIGEKEYQGKGIGKKAMHFIESTAYDLGFDRIELGVFSFNTRAIEFYKSLDYKPIGRIPRLTYYQKKWHDDLRFEKYI